MASSRQAQNSDLSKKLAARITETRQFLPLVVDGEKTTFLQLAKGVGSTDQHHPKRSIQRFLDALEMFQLARVSNDGVELLPSGRRFRSTSSHAAIVVRNAFVTAPVPRRILRAISQTSVLSKTDAEARLRAIGRESEIEAWLEWLAFAGFIDIRGNEITMQESLMDPRELYSNQELRRVREYIYRRLAMISDSAISAGANCFHRTIAELLADFRGAKPDDAEAPMMRLVEAALFRLGFEAQVANGPRDSGDKLHFGEKGEDVIAFFLQPPASASDSFSGFVVAAELKRTSSDKKAVTQALAAKGRVISYFSSGVAAFALTLSDSHGYVDKIARDYANANNVPHLSIDTLVALCDEQERRYKKASANLVTPIDIWHVLNRYQSENYIESQKDDFLAAVIGSADGRK